VWRLKKYYNVPDMMIYAHLIPISHKLKRASLMRMVQSKSLTELLGEIGNSPYGSVFSSMEGLELSYYREMSRVHLKSAAMHPNSLAVTASFLHAKELETNNIVSILEGVRYKLNPADIMSYLNLSREMEVR
jgi:vacuolar-type H+-ATPase subunit C/Vma6